MKSIENGLKEKSINDKLLKWGTLGVWGGSVYFFIEVVYKSFTGSSSQIHWSMWILGMVVFLCIGSINEHILYRGMPLWKQCGISAIIILVLEFIAGLIVNVWLGWNVWHYETFHIMHQVCLPFGIIWYFLSAFGIWLDDKLREKLFGEDKHTYKIF